MTLSVDLLYCVLQAADLPDVPAPGHGELVCLEAVEEVLLHQAEAGQGDEAGGAGPHAGWDRYSVLSFCDIKNKYIQTRADIDGRDF